MQTKILWESRNILSQGSRSSGQKGMGGITFLGFKFYFTKYNFILPSICRN